MAEQPRLGEYELAEELGRGAMGVVYRARRDFAGQEREFAVKIVSGLDTAEVQALALLDHANIIRLFDSGRTGTGRLYLVTELVRGQPIDQYCEERRLGERDRVAILAKAARALAYAHQQLVAHLDLKPSNVLVTEAGEPKLIDFGIARLLPAEEARTRGRGWTAEYASPEQARGERTGAASDVYSLGMLICKVLTNRLPYAIPAEPEQAAVEAIATAEAVLPSRLAAETGRRAGPEIDAIVRRALQKDPGRRYRSMHEMAEALEAYLQGRPVADYKDSLPYRLGKFLGRNQAIFGVPAIAAIFAGSVFLTVQSARHGMEQVRTLERSGQPRERLLPKTGAALRGWIIVDNLLRDYAPVLRRSSPQAYDAMLREIEKSLEGVRAQGLTTVTRAAPLADAYVMLACREEKRDAARTAARARQICLRVLELLPADDEANRRDLLERLAMLEAAASDYTNARMHIAQALEAHADAKTASRLAGLRELIDTYEQAVQAEKAGGICASCPGLAESRRTMERLYCSTPRIEPQ